MYILSYRVSWVPGWPPCKAQRITFNSWASASTFQIIGWQNCPSTISSCDSQAQTQGSMQLGAHFCKERNKTIFWPFVRVATAFLEGYMTTSVMAYGLRAWLPYQRAVWTQTKALGNKKHITDVYMSPTLLLWLTFTWLVPSLVSLYFWNLAVSISLHMSAMVLVHLLSLVSSLISLWESVLPSCPLS